ncbi:MULTISPECIES: DUF799 domain-containing protein [unclassified Roseateles]|uniref:DUF799 domain-containing protein n=1 Tax=unclassified Roseateles TaxID=2626991 RepID=UPI0006FF52DF|nr:MULTISPECIES: DUF799 domain-containing protein [unclassified Roseateles]KQW46344.1 hypothetical protein ASC81_08010 [Pelomonas sp. Root405]KRA73394.1 hypothetical protein ASD88_08010 [Pelomonas sp. Root662]
MNTIFRAVRRWAAAVGGAMALLALQGCATPPKPYDYTAYKEAKPVSILVLPPVNGTPEVQATPSVMVQMVQPLAESGYYVMPVSLVDETFKSNGMHTPDDVQQIPPAKLREIFGADAGLYVKVTRYGSVYKVLNSETAVTLEAKLIDLRNDRLLWEGSATASSAEQQNSSQAGLIGLLVQAVVEQIIASTTDRSHPMAGLASQRLLAAGRPNGLLYGPRSPSYGKP